MSADDPAVIVGGGIGGLTLGYTLAKAGRAVVVLERDAVIGGLAKSFSYDDYTFDVGPHRFYTEEAAVTAFITEILCDDRLLISRRSALYMAGRFMKELPLTNLTLSGRTGGFWYNNMDNSIAEALQLAARLKKERTHD